MSYIDEKKNLKPFFDKWWKESGFKKYCKPEVESPAYQAYREGYNQAKADFKAAVTRIKNRAELKGPS